MKEADLSETVADFALDCSGKHVEKQKQKDQSTVGYYYFEEKYLRKGHLSQNEYFDLNVVLLTESQRVKVASVENICYKWNYLVIYRW